MIQLQEWQFWLLMLLATPGVLLSIFMGWAGYGIGRILFKKD